MDSVNNSSEQSQNQAKEYSVFDNLLLLIKQKLPKHVDGIISSDAYLAMKKLQKHVLIEGLSDNKTYHKSEGNKFSIGVELEGEIVKIDKSCESNSHLKAELTEIDILDIPQDVRVLTKEISEYYNLDFFVSIATAHSEGNWMNMFPIEVDTYKKDSHGYCGNLSIGFQKKSENSDQKTLETNNWYIS